MLLLLIESYISSIDLNARVLSKLLFNTTHVHSYCVHHLSQVPLSSAFNFDVKLHLSMIVSKKNTFSIML